MKNRQKSPGKKNQSFYRIHNVNTQFNSFFSLPLYYLSLIVTFLLLISPYCFRIGLAFFINIIFNRPIVYKYFLFGKIIEKLNMFFITVFYFTFFGIYALLFKLFGNFRNPQKSNWVSIKKEDKESYTYLS